MHLSEQVFDNLEAFKERVEYVARDTDENDFIGAYTPNYSFYSDRLAEDSLGYTALVNAEWFENIAAWCICNYKFFDRIFHHRSISLLPCIVLPFFRPAECGFKSRISRQCEPDSSLG